MKLNKKKVVLGMIFAMLAIIFTVLIFPGNTSPVGENGIAKIESLTLGGVKQWIVIRSENIEKPVILLLSGGPGGTEMGRFLKFNKELENYFIVVNWEQRGCGKSYPGIKEKDLMTVQQYVSDIHELTEYLKKKFNKEKIYLLGHSWGTIIGTMAIKEKPENFYAYIGAAQMVNIQETDRYMYNFVLGAAEKNGDKKLSERMRKNGAPPYYGNKILDKYKDFLTNYAQYYMKENPFNEANREWYSLSSFLFLSEYNLIDQIRVLKGIVNTFELIYPQLQNVNFIKQINEIEIPVYYMIGKHDYTSLFIEKYFEILKAPKKELFWFENSAHGEIWTEADKFHDLVINKILPETFKN